MFVEEAKLCVALRHPNIVQVYDLGEIDSQYFIAMEYVDGRDLLKTLAACGKKRIGFPTEIALYIVMEVLKGLDYAHNLRRPDGQPLGIIHRDVSPSNVLLSFEGEVKIADFGIAKASTREKTETGILKGKFGYMAPEQVTGAPIDHRADIFAMGIVLYELITGHRLFAGKNDLAVLERVRDALIDPPPRHYRPDLAGELEAIVMRSLARDARDRFQLAAELHDALYEYTFRSRATIGPPQLAKFMQELFLADPEEIVRRARIFLPVVAAPSSATPHHSSAAVPAVNAEPDPLSSGGFEEATPLMEEPPPMPPSRVSPRRLDEDVSLSGLGSVAFIAPDEQWEKTESPDSEHGTAFPNGEMISGEAQLAPSRRHSLSENTARTDVRIQLRGPSSEVEAIDIHTGQVLSASVDDESVQMEAVNPFDEKTESPESQAEAAREEVRALRAAREENFPTDLDLDGKKRAEVNASLQRGASNFDTVISSGHAAGEDELDDDQAVSDRDFSPAQIVERTLSARELDQEEETNHGADVGEEGPTLEREEDGELYETDHSQDDEEDERREIEATVRVDSGEPLRKRLEQRRRSLELLQQQTSDSLDEADPSDLISLPGPNDEEGPSDFLEQSDYGTIEVLESDLPTSEVSESALLELGYQIGDASGGEPLISSVDVQPLSARPTVPVGDTGSGLIEDTRSDEAMFDSHDETRDERGALKISSDSTSVPVMTPLYEPTHPEDFDDETENMGDAAERVLAQERSTSAVQVVDPIRVAEPRAQSRRRPITASKRPRPVLLPAGEEEEDSESGDEPSRSSPRRRPVRGASRVHSVVPRRRIAARSSLSVVNPRIPLQQDDPTPFDGEEVVSLENPPVASFAPAVQLAPIAPDVPVARSSAAPEETNEHTGAGMLLPDEVTDSGEMAAVRKDSRALRETKGERQASLLPERRSSSGVTAALDEAAAIEEEIALIRSGSVEIPSEPEHTTAGSLTPEEEEELEDTGGEMSPLEEDADGKTDLHRAIMRRQSRRRFATNSVVLFGEDAAAAMAQIEDSQSIPVITNAGRLEDDGAEDLFGALSMLDSSPLELSNPSFSPDDEISVDTESGNVEPVDMVPVKKPPLIAPSVSMEMRLPPDLEISRTGMGSLHPDAEASWGGIAKDPASEAEDSIGDDTASVTDGQVMEISAVKRSSLLPEDDEYRPVIADEASIASRPAVERRASSGIEIAFGSLRNSDPIEELDSEHSTGVEDDSEVEVAIGRKPRDSSGLYPVNGRGYSNGQNGHVKNGLNGHTNGHALDDEYTPEGGLDPLNEEVHSKEGGMRLISDSFDIGAALGATASVMEARPGVGSSGKKQPAPKPLTAPPKADVIIPQKSRSKPAVEKRGPIKEVKRNSVAQPGIRPPVAERMRPSPAPGSANGMLGAGTPILVVPSASQAYPPLARPDRSVGNRLVIPTVLLAVALAIAAAVVLSLDSRKSWFGGGNVKIPTMKQSPKELAKKEELAKQEELAKKEEPANEKPANEKKAPEKKTVALVPDEKPAPKKVETPPKKVETEKKAVEKAEPEKAERDEDEDKVDRRAPKKKAKRANRAPAEAAASSTTGALSFDCEEPSTITLRGPAQQKLANVTKKTVRTEPGRYVVTIVRDGRAVGTSQAVVIAGQTAKIACP
jgi:serine/threonine protein kinase